MGHAVIPISTHILDAGRSDHVCKRFQTGLQVKLHSSRTGTDLQRIWQELSPKRVLALKTEVIKQAGQSPGRGACRSYLLENLVAEPKPSKIW
jgi:hypothetical protein